jgi:D-psicose/D-tagatose/L-ribulose 3-epimerase
VGEVARDRGVKFCLEILNRFEGYLINTVEQGLRMLEEVDQPSVKLHLDTFHMNIEEPNLGDAIRKAGQALGHFHASENNRRRPGVGHIPWVDIRRALDDIDYDGWIVMESFVRPQGEVGQTLSIWHDQIDDLAEEARLGSTFLRRELS